MPEVTPSRGVLRVLEWRDEKKLAPRESDKELDVSGVDRDGRGRPVGEE